MRSRTWILIFRQPASLDIDFQAANVVADSPDVDLENRNRHLLEIDNGLELINALNDCDNALENTVLLTKANNIVVGEEIVTENRVVGFECEGLEVQLGPRPICDDVSCEMGKVGLSENATELAHVMRISDKQVLGSVVKESTINPPFSSSSFSRAKPHKSGKGVS